MSPLILLFGLLGTAGSVFLTRGNESSGKTFGHDGSNSSPGEVPSQGGGKNKTEPVTDVADTTTKPVGEETNSTDTETGTGNVVEETGTQGGTVTVEAPQQSGDGSAGAESTTTPLEGGSVEVMTGRVTTLQPSDSDIAGIKIVSAVEHGTITVNPDNTLALVMTKSDFTGSQSFTYEVTHSDGSTSLYQTDLNVIAGAQAGGWGTGESHYMLETDADDRIIVEHGENHTKLYVSGSADALSRTEIAAREGLSESQITNDWLINSEYGKSEELALETGTAMDVWGAMNPRYSETSDWLLFERGYEYQDVALVSRYSGGESELNPVFIGAWGEGERPEITTSVLSQDIHNVVIQDIHFSGSFMLLQGQNVILDNVKVTDGGSAIMNSAGITVRNSEFIDNYPDEPQGTDWHPHVDRAAGIYMNNVDGTLWEGNFFDHNGWADGYESGDGPAPSMFSHNIYFDADMTDVTLRDTISMRASSYGAQVRSGGFIEDNLFVDNNAAVISLGGDYEGSGAIGEYTLFQGNVVTYAAYKEADMIGALSLGLQDRGQMTALVDNIVAHLADPNSDELTWKWWNHGGLEVDETVFYDDTVVWNWQAGSGESPQINEQNIDGLDQAVLDQTTIQLFAEQLTGIQNATTADLADYLRAQADGSFDELVDADLINRFFQEGFGVATDIRASAETITFVPNDNGEGVRWDNRLNWETNDLPGLYPDDSVDLGGNYVAHGANTTIDTIDFSDGQLNLYGGRLNATGGLEDGGHLTLEGTGQIWAGGSDGSALDIEVSDSGRFVNTGDMSGVNLTANDGQAILATDGGEFEVSASRVLTVFEGAQVGFDDDDGDMAILDIHDEGTIAFEAGNGGLGEIGEFRSGAFGDSPNVLSGIDLGNGTLSLNLTGLSASEGATFQLMSADEIVGIFDEALIDGLGAQDARVVVDYANDTVTLELTVGNGAVSIDTIGEQTDVSSGAEALWEALTSGQEVVPETQSALQGLDEDFVDAA